MSRRKGATAEPTAQETALIRQRDLAAVQLATAGASYEEIAQQLGYADKSGAWKAVRRALDRQEARDVEALRDQELARLDRLQLGVWQQATKGEVAAVMAALRIIDRRIRLLGLDLPQQVHLDVTHRDLTDAAARAAEAAGVRDELKDRRQRTAAS